MKKLIISRSALVTICVLCLSSIGQAQYSLENAYPNLPAFSSPLEIVRAGDGTNRLFVVQQRGIIWVFENNPTVSSRTAFVDLSDRVSQSGFELGLLGVAFHPNYETNGYFYVNYTRGPQGGRESVIARFQVSPSNPDSALKETEFPILIFSQPYDNHNGGKLLFGPDGYLYIGTGDGGDGGDPGNRAQNRDSLHGKVLRIDVDNTDVGLNYAIPPTNPYYDNMDGYREEIYAYGLRNPWKFSFDSETGTLWLGDVGQETREEVDIIVSGGNYGWRIMEGTVCYNPPSGCDTTGLILPVWDYANETGAGTNYSVTGGYVYRGSSISSLVGKYIYSDYGSGRIWALTYDGENPATNELLYDSPYQVSSFGEDQNGELLVLSYSGGNGRIYRLTGPVTGVEETETTASTFVLQPNYPNPFNPSTTVRFSVSSEQLVKLNVFDVLGRHVATLLESTLHPGEHSVIFEPKELPSGVFLLRLEAGGFVQTRKLIYQR